MVQAEQRKEWMKSRRNRRKQARRARLNRQVFRYVVLLALLYGGCAGLAKLPWQTRDLQGDVVVHGGNVVSADQVKTALGDIKDKRVFQLDPRKLEKRVESLKAVKYAFVRRYTIPKPTIVVEILEEFPWASFSTSPDLPPQAVIAQTGRLIPIKDFPRIAKPDLVVYGPPAMKINGKSVSNWASIIAFITAQTGQPVQFVDLRRPFDICVQNGDLFLKLGAADATLKRRLGRLSSILTAIEPLKTRLEFVDLSLDNNIPLKIAKKPLDGHPYHGDIDHLQQAQLPGHGRVE
jgi:hypothetical protein